MIRKCMHKQLTKSKSYVTNTIQFLELRMEKGASFSDMVSNSLNTVQSSIPSVLPSIKKKKKKKRIEKT